MASQENQFECSRPDWDILHRCTPSLEPAVLNGTHCDSGKDKTAKADFLLELAKREILDDKKTREHNLKDHLEMCWISINNWEGLAEDS